VVRHATLSAGEYNWSGGRDLTEVREGKKEEKGPEEGSIVTLRKRGA